MSQFPFEQRRPLADELDRVNAEAARAARAQQLGCHALLVVLTVVLLVVGAR